MKTKIDMVTFLDIMIYLDHLTDTGNLSPRGYPKGRRSASAKGLSPAQCVADEFDLSLELGKWAVKQWEEVENRKRKASDDIHNYI